MTVSMKFPLSLACIILLLQACYPELDDGQDPSLSNQNTNRYPEVDEQLWNYFSSFEQEAMARGVQIDLRNLEISGVIENISENGVAGTCQYGRHIHHVTIDRSFWNRNSHLGREMVVFHELGHCALERGHKEVEDRNGSCLSIMNSGTSGCRVLYSQANRDYYLDELFEYTD